AATKLLPGDEVLGVVVLESQRNIILQTKEGFFLRFSVEEFPEKKTGAFGVRGMKLGPSDRLAAIHFTYGGIETAIDYHGKPLDLASLKPGHRDTKGTKIRK
ncbi:MAG: DNA topoisomerase, partial [Lachnospiraceae bacterium]|nr:DNA topoisomerase [Lachnospiraceae bacterium]